MSFPSLGQKRRTSAMDTSQLYCPNPECPNYGETGKGNIRCFGTYGKRRTQRFQCRTCKGTFSSRRGTAFFHLHADEETICRVLIALAEGNSIRATARIFRVDKDTVCRWLDRAAKQCEQVSQYLMKELHIEECQLDELWSFIKKKRRISPP